MPSIKVTTTKTEAKVTVDETQAVIAITESPVEIVTGTSGPQGATGVVQAVAPITYDLQNASVGINIGQNLETSANTLKVTDDLTAIDSIAFDTAAGETSAVGKIVWNDTEGTLEFGLKGGNVTLQIGQEQVVHVRNNTGSTLLNGQAVYITSANAGQINVTLASNNTEASSSKTLGILTEDIPNGQQGYCTTQGLVRGLDTSHLTEGATIWLGTNGNLTTTRPSAPANSVVIGVCVSQSNGQATNGIIFVRVINGFELEELHDVLITSPADNEVLTYEASSGLWKNKTNPADGVTSITASSPLTGGTITSTGTIGLDQTALSITAGQVGGTAVIRTDNLFTFNGTAIPFGGTATSSSYITAVASPITYNGGTAGLDQTALSIQPSQVAGTAVITTDSRLSDARTPTGHAASHASAGSDPVTLAQSQVTNLTTDLASKLNASNPLLTRIDSSNEGGQINFARASDGASYWFLDSFGNTSTPNLRVVEDATVRATFIGGGGLTVESGVLTAPQASLTAPSAAVVPLTITGAASQSGNLQEWRNSSGSLRMRVSSNGGLISESGEANAFGGAAISGIILAARANSASIIPFGVRAAASQTANMTEWQDSTGTVQSRVSSSGILTGLRTISGSVTQAAVGTLTVYQRTTTEVASAVRGIASGTANLQEWQNSAGTVLARVDSAGRFYSTASINTGNSYTRLQEGNSGGIVTMTKATAQQSSPGAGNAHLYFRDGTNAGTLKLVVRAGAAGAETTILDNIPQ